MKNLRPFQIALLAGFAVTAVVALILLSTTDPQGSDKKPVYGNSVVIWGTIDGALIDNLFLNIAQEDKAFNVVRYEEVDEASINDELVNAIAEGRAPDAVIIQSDQLVDQRAKLLSIPYESFPLRDYRDTYIDVAEVFALNDGVYGVPFAVDPLIMYWNRDMFATAGLAQAPQSWEVVAGTVVPSMTVVNDNRDVLQSGLAFGEYRNVRYAKDIIMTLAIQSGSQLVSETDRGYRVALNDGQGSVLRPMESAVQFFTNFSNSNSARYSWNRAQPLDRQAFVAGDLALYFGRASEVETIQNQNPNLNFDTAPVPQGGAATVRRTYGTVYAFAFPRSAANTEGAYAAANKIAEPKFANELTRALNMAPVRRDLMQVTGDNLFRATIIQSALIARTWLDPEAAASSDIFQQMIDDVVSNRARVSEAVNDAIQRLVLEY